jgi:ATP-dependent Clp endopeptidase proteolytic subunit ClpP
MSTKRSKKRPQPRKTKLNAIDRIDSIRLTIDYGIDLVNRTLLISGAVNEGMYDQVAYGLSVLNQLQAESIIIRLNTEGGSLYAALGIFDLIKYNKTPVDILATGTCMSAGTVIMQAARKRQSTSLTQFMIHHGSEYVAATHKDFQRYAAHSAELESKMEKLFCERCNWDDEKYAELHKHDTYLSAEEARRLNLIDEVV